ncbi:MAG: hypothetical protein K0R38_235 [Polyangiaceae bacterium]|nr:hypothetical protein [Polyangiaceae bacterium]
MLTVAASGGCRNAEPSASASRATTPVSPGPGGPAHAGAAASGSKEQMPATARKVIRSAELRMEVASPSDAEAKVSELVERLGGYVASSEHQAVSGAERRAVFSLRVPSARLEEALRELKKLSVGPQDEKIGSDDVTDEYIDVGARVANQIALEKQLVQILGQATNVDQAIKVHHELSSVRTEIDRLQGRLRFLETESALAKVTLTLLPQPQVLATAPATFWDQLRDATWQSVQNARAIALGAVLLAVQVAGVLVPLAALLAGPLTLLLWWRRRRYQRLVA